MELGSPQPIDLVPTKPEDGGPAAPPAPPEPLAPRQSRWSALVHAAAAVRSTDPARVEVAVQDLAGRARWLKPLAYAAGTVAVVFDGVLLLIRHWRLTLLQLVPAVWVWAMAWNLRNRMLVHPAVSTTVAVAIALGVLVATQAAYWCNATFGYTIAQGDTTDIRAAFAEARPHWRFVGGLALLTGSIQAAIVLVLRQTQIPWLWILLVGMFIVQIYLFVAIPSWLLGVRKTGSRRERIVQTLTTGVLSGVAAAPGFLLNRIGFLLFAGGAFWIGVVLVSIGAVLHVTASCSVRVVKGSLRLRPSRRRASRQATA